MLTISAIINTTTPSDNDDNRILNPAILSMDFTKLHAKCGVSFDFNIES